MVFEERQRVPWWWWLGAALAVGVLAVAVFSYVPPLAASAVCGFFALGLAVALRGYGSATIRVEGDVLRVGRNTIEGRWIASAEALTDTDTAHAMGAGADTRDFLHTRPYIGRAVRVHLADPADPHPHWLVSSRRPGELAAAVSAMATGTP